MLLAGGTMRLKLKPKLFELVNWNMQLLANALGVHLSLVHRIRRGERGINEKFIVGALTAFPDKKFEDFFYIEEVKNG